MNELIKINNDDPERPTVSGRELHEFLEVGTKYQDWFPRMREYGFEEGKDFIPIKIENVLSQKRERTYSTTDHQITVPMAKELCMIQRNERGKQARQYFIAVEEEWNSPDAIMQRALRIADARVAKLHSENLSLQTANSKLSMQVQIAQPKVEYFDELVDRNLLTNFRETAKQLKVKERAFVQFLLDRKYIYRDKRGKLMPYAEKSDGLFEMKECFNEKTQWSGTQTLVTPKGRETFRLLCQGL